MNDIKIKHILKKFLIFGIAVLLVSCSEELFEEQLAQQNKLTVKEQSFSELVKDKKFNRLMRTLSGLQQVSRSAFENQNGFTISTAPVKVIETDSLTSYTMQILCDNPVDNISLYNLVLQEDILNNQKAVIYKYTPISISSTTHNSFHFDGTIDKFSLGYSTQMNRPSQQNITMSDCYDYILMCNYGGTEHPAGVNCTRTYVKKFKVICATPPFEGGFGDTGGGGGGANENPSEENNDIVTTPVLTVDNPKPKDPCVQLNKITSNFQMKNALVNLQSKTNLTSEYGYSISKNSNGHYADPVACNASINNPNAINMKIGGNNVGAFHTHPDATETDTYPMFSDGDLNWLYWVAIQNQTPSQDKIYEEFFLTLTVPQGTFAIKIKDWTKFAAFRNSPAWKNYNEGTIGELENLRTKYDNLQPTSNFNSITNAFLEILRDSNTGIGLYEASPDLTSWSELTLSPDSAINTTSPPIKKPCSN